MDPINYVPQSPQRLSPRSDPVHGHDAWLTETHHAMRNPWPNHYLPSPQPSRGLPGLDPFQLGMQGALPHPDRNLRPPPPPAPTSLLGMASLSENHPWFPQASSYPGGLASAAPGSHGGLPPVGFMARMGGAEVEGNVSSISGPLPAGGRQGFVNMNRAPAGVPLSQRLPTLAQQRAVAAITDAATGAVADAAPGATPEARAPLQFSPAEHRGPLIANGSSAPPPAPPPPLPAVVNHQPSLPQPQTQPQRQRPHHRHHPSFHLALDQTTPPRRVAIHGSPSPTTPPSPHTPRTNQGRNPVWGPPLPTPRNTSALPSPVSDRRRQGYSRARRYMSSRHGVSDPTQDQSSFMDTGEHSRRVHSATGGLRLARGDSDVLWEEDASVRQAQLARGAEVKLIASRAALCTLQSVSKDDLPKNEQICVICYNEYNEMSPEGVSEAPLRLPRCKHVFGDHCIKKWFEESDSCPYCRDKLPSEPKTHQATARAFMNIMRLRGVSTGELDSSLYRAITSGSMTEAQVSAYLDSMRPRGPVAERRSPPNDTTGQDQRRTRRRRRSPSPRGALGGASTRDEVSVRPTDGAALGSDDVSRASASYTGHTLALLQYEQVLNARRRHLNSTTGGDTAGAEQVQAGMPPMEGLRSVATWDSSQHGSQ